MATLFTDYLIAFDNSKRHYSCCLFYISGANSASLIPCNDLYTFCKSTYVDHQMNLIQLLIFQSLSSYLIFNGANKLGPTTIDFSCPTRPLQPFHVTYSVGQNYFLFLSC